MAPENDHTTLSPTVQKVIEKFVSVMVEDPDIPDDAIERLQTLLNLGPVPKNEEIKSAMFEPPEAGI